MQLFEHTQGNLKNNMLCRLILHPMVVCLFFDTRSRMCTSLAKCVSFDVLMLASMKSAVMMMDTDSAVKHWYISLRLWLVTCEKRAVF
jgi:hypothetical protein